MRKAPLLIFSIFIIFVLCVVLSNAQQQSVLIYRWQDENGNFFYTDNYSTIPIKYRNTVVVGRFVVEGSVLPPQKDESKSSATPSSPQTPFEVGVYVLQDSYQIRDNYLQIEGQVKNLLDKTITEVRVNIEFYDKYGQLLSTASVYLVPPVLRPGEVGKFVVSTPLNPRFHYYKTEIMYRER